MEGTPPEDERREDADAEAPTLPGGWLPPAAAQPGAPPAGGPSPATPPPGQAPPQAPAQPGEVPPAEGRPAAQQPPPAAQQPAWGAAAGQQAPPPGYGQPPPGYAPPGYAPPPGWGAWPQPAWRRPAGPGNPTAITGFVLSVAALGLLVLTVGFSTLVSLGLAIAGTIVARNGREKVDRGETPQHRGLAQAGFVVGLVAIGLSVLATVAWVAFFLDVLGDLGGEDDPFEDDFRITRVAALALACALRLGL